MRPTFRVNLLAILKGHLAPVRTVAIAPDGKCFAPWRMMEWSKQWATEPNPRPDVLISDTLIGRALGWRLLPTAGCSPRPGQGQIREAVGCHDRRAVIHVNWAPAGQFIAWPGPPMERPSLPLAVW